MRSLSKFGFFKILRYGTGVELSPHFRTQKIKDHVKNKNKTDYTFNLKNKQKLYNLTFWWSFRPLAESHGFSTDVRAVENRHHTGVET